MKFLIRQELSFFNGKRSSAWPKCAKDAVSLLSSKAAKPAVSAFGRVLCLVHQNSVSCDFTCKTNLDNFGLRLDVNARRTTCVRLRPTCNSVKDGYML